MRVVIAGAGAVGTFIANELAQGEHQVLVLDQDPAALAPSHFSDSVELKLADACEVSSLQEAGLADADVVVAATGDDEDNLVVSLLAKTEFAVDRVIARVNHPKNEWLFNEAWGVDLAVSQPHLITAFVEEAVSVGTLVRLLQLEGGAARIVEVTLADSSPAVDQVISEMDAPRDSNFVAILRDESVVVPRGDTVFQAGDEVFVLVTPDSEDEVRALLVG